ncbi:hypothetical protein [Variovorax sp. J31P207]|uniref:hypothetical protein n=1 Tax=Variovorax sp. J31P207 TaxID=3053510 RepID=UPI0025770487|nr:hypothetical protein [Variovorax sp. J31P207]MDM0071811.1 hypothetical protein [Variovorax sp. J31P207]
MAYGFVRRQGLEVDAITLRSPFYLQCFFSAPLVVSVAIATTLHRAGNDVAAGVMAGVGGAWYLGVQGVWFGRRLAVDRSLGFAIALGLFAVSLVIVAVVGVVIFGLGRGAAPG